MVVESYTSIGLPSRCSSDSTVEAGGSAEMHGPTAQFEAMMLHLDAVESCISVVPLVCLLSSSVCDACKIQYFGPFPHNRMQRHIGVHSIQEDAFHDFACKHQGTSQLLVG